MPTGIYPRKKKTHADRLTYVEKNVSRDCTSKCWNWIGSMHGRYGRLCWHQQKIMAHRFSWETYNGPIPDNLYVLHKCDNCRCVNPSHLFLGTLLDNNLDRDQKGRQVTLRGESNGNSKLTPDDVRAIRSSGLKQRELAKQFNVDQALISAIRLRKVWVHI